MGGVGSTRWGNHTKKRLVEKCLQLDVQAFRLPNGQQAFQRPGTTGTITWSNGIAVQYSIEEDDSGLVLKLLYAVQGFRSSILKNPTIYISSTKCNYGGQRFWLHCPECQRRSGCLYLFNGDFACRQCHNLTYTSTQSAHHDDRLFKKIDALLHGAL